MPHSAERSREQNFRHLYRQYRRRANKKNQKFTLTEARFRELTKQPCYICGKRPSARYRRDSRAANKTPYIYSGIDRFSSRRGYVEGNVLACCWVCNRAKGTMSIEKFLLYILRAYKHIIEPALQEGLPNE